MPPPRARGHQGRQGIKTSYIIVTIVLVAPLLFLLNSQWQRVTNARTVVRQLEAAHAASVAKVSQARKIVAVAEPDPCAPSQQQPHVELWGDVVVAGLGEGGGPGGLSAPSAQACCRSCQKQRGCNEWVWCSNPAICGQQCWLKRVGNAKDMSSHAAGDNIPWTSGSLKKDFDVDVATLPPVDTSIDTVQLTTAFGAIRIALKPDWSASSVEYVRRLAQNPQLCSTACEFYRAEPGFLLQGSLRSYIPPNNKTTPGPKFMERGEIGWAGGSAGPDWFIYLATQAATHWNHDHTVWGVIADDESLAVVEKCVTQPAKAPTPGAMHMLVQRIAFNISVARR